MSIDPEEREEILQTPALISDVGHMGETLSDQTFARDFLLCLATTTLGTPDLPWARRVARKMFSVTLTGEPLDDAMRKFTASLTHLRKRPVTRKS